MYDNYFGFSAPPFQLTPDSRFFFDSVGHSRAISHLLYGLAQEEGFIVITGEVGAGKTTLVEQLWSRLDQTSFVMARIVTTLVSGEDLLRLAVAGIGVAEPPVDKAGLLRCFETAVREHRAAGRRCLLVIDEAQNLTIAALEELRMLSNLTVDGHASLQTILLGQPQFRSMLGTDDLDQLRQRVLASFHLGPLTEAETRAYIEHRLRKAGWTGDPAWGDACFAPLFHHTGGVPRRINTLCSRVLLYAALEEAHAIAPDMVETTAAELARDLGDGAPLTVRTGLTMPLSGLEFSGRIAAMEAEIARQRRTIGRLVSLLGTYAEPYA